MKSFSPLAVLLFGVLLGVFRIAAKLADYAPVGRGAALAASIVGLAGTAGVAVWIAFLMAPRPDWRRAVFVHAGAAQALAVVLRVGLRAWLDPGAAGGPAGWIVVAVPALLSGAAFGAVLVAFAWALRRFDFVRPEPRPDDRR